jgi:hypothetical protein
MATVDSLSRPSRILPSECTAVSTNGDTKHASKMTQIRAPIHLRHIISNVAPKLISFKQLFIAVPSQWPDQVAGL